MATIYLGSKHGTSSNNIARNLKVSIQISKSIYEKCRSFEVVTYSINYSGSYHKYLSSSSNISNYYKVFIFQGHQTRTNRAIYNYWASTIGGIVEQVDSYYHLSNSDLPLALVFSTRDNKKSYCTYEKLKQSKNHKVLAGTVTEEGKVYSQLLNEYKSKYKTFQFTIGSGSNLHLVEKSLSIGNGRKFKRVIFLRNQVVREGSGFLLNSENLFTEESKRDSANKIDSLYLKPVEDQQFDAVIVYYTDSSNHPKDLAVLIEFIKDCQKTYIKRINNNPPVWIVEEVKYDNDEELIRLLSSIKEDSQTAVTYKLEKNANDSDGYKEDEILVADVPVEGESEYSIHTHLDLKKSGKRVILLYKDKPIEFLENKKEYHTGKLNTSHLNSLDQISTYVLTSNEKEHLLIRLTEKSGTNYYFHRFSKDGINWRQVGTNFLKDAGIEVDDGGEEKLDKKLEQLLNEKSKPNNVKALLKYISFSLNSVVVILDKKSRYNQSNINSIINNEIPPIDIDKNEIQVDNKQDSECIKPYNYRVYRHNLQSAGRSAKQRLSGSGLYLRFYLDKKGIRLYDNAGGTHAPLEYKESTNHLYVYYYGDTDPRPLLFCYDDKAYSPSSKDEYESKWFKSQRIQTCLCNGNGNDILAELLKVLQTLNPVNIFQGSRYLVHTFKVEIYINVAESTLKCYNTYEHEPTNGYCLGKVEYKVGEASKGSITYTAQKDLNKVKTYYYKHDNTKGNPLLVYLEFKDSTKEYHKLVEPNNYYRWKKITEDELDGQDKLLTMLFTLNREFNVHNSTRPDERDCTNNIQREGGSENTTLETALGSTGGVLAVGGTGLLVYKYSDFIFSLLRKAFSKVVA